MRGRRRFPLWSTLVVFALGGVVGWLTYNNADVPAIALQQVRDAVSIFGESLSSMTAARPYVPAPTPESGYFPVLAAETAAPEDTLPLLVNANHSLAADYAPQDLVNMLAYCDPTVVLIKGNEIEGDRTAVDALVAMFRSAMLEGMGDWQISAGYRSVEYQQQLWDSRVQQYKDQGLSDTDAVSATAQYVAVPGASEHHTGLAFDVTVPGESFASTPQSAWLAEHCWEYGFIIRYTAEKQGITGIAAEPWHIRYVGEPHAITMRDNNWCLEEYIAANKRETLP